MDAAKPPPTPGPDASASEASALERTEQLLRGDEACDDPGELMVLANAVQALGFPHEAEELCGLAARTRAGMFLN